MLETGVRQFRMAMSMVWGRRMDTTNLARLVEDARATLREFGSPDADAQDVIDGPSTDPAERLEFALRALRRTARRLAAQSPFYTRRFAAADVPPGKLDLQALWAIPVTVKRDLIDRPDEFRCADVAPYLTTRTTGTTGRAAELWLSRYELDLWSGLGALAGLLRGDLLPSDVMQVNVSSRATASSQLTVATCHQVGAGCRLIGIVPPDEALDSLTAGATLLASVPSYLAELVAAARRRGLGPVDFTLRRIDVGGEVLSSAVATAARETFGVPLVNDTFAMTEVIPVTGRRCTHDHLHHDVKPGLRGAARSGQRRAGRARRPRHRRHHSVLPAPRVHAGVPLRHPRPHPAAARRAGDLRAGRGSRYEPRARQGRSGPPPRLG